MGEKQATMRIVWAFERTDQLWGGVKVALTDANWLQANGHDVTVVSRTAPPAWMQVQCRFVQTATLTPESLPPADLYIGTFWTTVPAVAAAAQARGAVAVHYCQGYEGDNPEFAAVRDRIEAVYRLPGMRHVTISPHLTELLRERFGIRATQVVYTIDHDAHRPADQASAPRTRIRVGLVGPYEVPWKDIKTGLAACRLAAAAGQEIELVRVTNTAPHPEEASLPFPVEWHERVRPDEMGSIYRSLDVFLGTSSGHQEGFFLPAVEAMACGVPCVLTDIPCFRAHGDGQYALFVPPRDPAAMAEALVLAARVPAIRAGLRAGGIAAAARYTQQRHGESLDAALRSFCAEQIPATKAPIHEAPIQQVPAAHGMTAALLQAAEQAKAQRDFAAAADLLTAAHVLSPGQTQILLQAADARLSAGGIEQALVQLSRAVEDGCDDGAVHLLRADLQVAVGHAAAAAQSLRAAITAGVGSADVHNRRGGLLFTDGDAAGARAEFERALTADPANEDARCNLAALPAA